MKRLLLLATLCVAGAAHSAQLFYGGDFDNGDGLANEQNTVVSDSRVYDNFILLNAATATHLYSNNLTNANIKSAYWEIRTGVSAGNGGALVASGTSAATVTATGRSGFGFDEYNVDVAVNVNLSAFTMYWFTVAPIGDGNGRSFLSTTSGLNSFGTPVGDGKAYWDSSFFGQNFSLTTATYPNDHDFSMGVIGQAVPEPMTFAVLGLGALALKKRRK